MVQNIVEAQTKNAQNDLETWMKVPEGERFITREEVAHILHVNFTTLWRWNKQGHLHSRKIGGCRVMCKYSDVLALLNGEIKTYSSICRMGQSSKADSYTRFERFKRFRTHFEC